jgi:hypothetical protein
MAAPHAKDLAVFWGHGTDDQVVGYRCQSTFSLHIFRSMKLIILTCPDSRFEIDRVDPVGSSDQPSYGSFR